MDFLQFNINNVKELKDALNNIPDDAKINQLQSSNGISIFYDGKENELFIGEDIEIQDLVYELNKEDEANEDN